MALIKAGQVAWCRNTPEIRSTWRIPKERAYFCICTERVKEECVCIGGFLASGLQIFSGGQRFMHRGNVWYGSKGVAFC